MRKLLPLMTVLFLFSVLSLSASACPNCEAENTFVYHYTTDYTGVGGHHSATLQYLPESVSAPVYEIYTEFNGFPYIIFLSDAPFSAALIGKNGDNTNCSWSGSGALGAYSDPARYFIMCLGFTWNGCPLTGWEYTAYSRGKPANEVTLTALGKDGSGVDQILLIDTSGMTPVISSDGSIYQPPSYDSVTYDFTLDLYNPEYPLPELYDLTYDSFSIHNPNGYAFDLVVQTVFYGTKMQKYTEGGNHYITDKLRKFAKHEYNFTLSDSLSISGLVNIKDIYSVDLLETFKKDWIDWSNLYPTLDTIPGYSWINSIGYTARNYLNYRVYNEELVNERGLLVSLDLTNCCEVKYFVRFRDDSGYGQWMVYTVSGTDSDGVAAEVGEAGKPAYIVTGAVSGSTASGVPIITDPVTQRFDPINEQYDVVLNDGSEINWNYSVENFQSAFSFFGEMPNFVSAVFSCYPAWMVEIIGATITFLCALAIYHGIRG